jgi:hypothetical protein
LSAVLSSPEFIFRIERDPMNAGSNRLRQGYGGPPERSAKAEEQDPAYVRRADPSVGTRQGVYAISDV